MISASAVEAGEAGAGGAERKWGPGADRPSEKFSSENWKGLEGCLQEKQKKLYEDTGVTRGEFFFTD